MDVNNLVLLDVRTHFMRTFGQCYRLADSYLPVPYVAGDNLQSYDYTRWGDCL
jgi:hypothetical protein